MLEGVYLALPRERVKTCGGLIRAGERCQCGGLCLSLSENDAGKKILRGALVILLGSCVAVCLPNDAKVLIHGMPLFPLLGKPLKYSVK